MQALPYAFRAEQVAERGAAGQTGMARVDELKGRKAATADDGAGALAAGATSGRKDLERLFQHDASTDLV